MRIINKIVFAIVAITLLNSCGGKHKEGDGHDHGTEETKGAESATEDHGDEQSSTIASLTQEQMQAAGIVLGNIERKNLAATIKVNGALRVPNNRKANATSSYGGVVKSLSVQLGNYVRKGQVIATIENPQFVQLQEEYLTIGSRITLAEQEVQRQKELNEGNAGALKNLQSSTAELTSLRARKASLQQQIRMMGINPNNITASNLRSALVVTSPISGTVSNEFAKIGSYVDVSSPVVEIVDNGLLHLDLQVFEKDLPNITVGQTVYFTLTNNPKVSYTAKVFNIGSSFENESKTVAVHCTVVGNKAGLIDGMNITALVSIDDVVTPAVPNDAIVEADGKFYIFILTDKEAKEHKEENHEEKGGENQEHKNQQNFEKIEVMKGVSELGYTAITPVTEIPANAKIVSKGAFFINAKLSNTGGHEH